MFIAFVFLSLLTVQSSWALPSNSNITRDLIGQIIDGLENLRKIVEGAIAAGLKQFQKIIDDMWKIGNGILQTAEKELKAIVDTVKKEIEKLRLEAMQMGIDISDCVDGREHKIDQIVKDTLSAIRKCVSDQVEKVAQFFKDTEQSIRNEVDRTIDDLQESAKQCGSGIGSIVCLGKIVLDISSAVIRFPIMIADRVLATIATVGDVSVSLVACNAGISIEAGKLVTQSLLELTDCALKVFLREEQRLNDDISEGLAKLKITLRETSDKLKISLNSLLESFGLQFIEEMSNSLTNVAELNYSLEEFIKQLNQKAEESGIDISNCVSSIRKDFGTASDDFINGVQKCALAAMDESQIYNNEFIASLNAWLDIPPNFNVEWKECGKGTAAINCLKKVLNNIKQVNNDTPKEGEIMLNKIDGLLNELLETEKNCNLGYLQQYSKGYDEITQKGQECVDGVGNGE